MDRDGNVTGTSIEGQAKRPSPIAAARSPPPAQPSPMSSRRRPASV